MPVACTLSPTSGSYRTTVTDQCSGFRRGETVDVRWDSTSGTTLTSFTAGSGGVGSATFRVPSSKRGAHSVYAVGRSSGRSTRAIFSVRPLMTISPSSGLRGTRVTVRLYGFGAREQITVRWFRTSSSYSRGRRIAGHRLLDRECHAHLHDSIQRNRRQPQDRGNRLSRQLGQQDVLRHAAADGNADENTDIDPDQHGDSNRNLDTHGNADDDADRHDRNAVTHGDAHAVADRDADIDGDAN